MKLLLVSKLDQHARAGKTITKYVETGRALGHEVAVFGEELPEFPSIRFSLDVQSFDFAIFVVYLPGDFPDLPYLAHLLDGMPKERRVIIDCCGRYNETIRVEHDFNHLEKLDGHQGWEWIEGFDAVSDKILQPTSRPLRSDVKSFLFHAFDPQDVAHRYASAKDAAEAWSLDGDGGKEYGAIYVGNNWQRWTQIASFLEAVEPIKDRLGRICLAGWDWDKRPDWAIEHGLRGVDLDPKLLDRLGVERINPIPLGDVVPFVSRARFAPVFHRPLFNELGLITTRTFETFCADAIPILLLPHGVIESVYGPDAKTLAPGDDVAGWLDDALTHPEAYWDAVLSTRAHLAQHHSFTKRFEELLAILER